MPKFFVPKENIKDDKIYITSEDVAHIKKVLRYKIDDQIDVCDENGTRYKTKIEDFEIDKVILINSFFEGTHLRCGRKKKAPDGAFF